MNRPEKSNEVHVVNFPSHCDTVLMPIDGVSFDFARDLIPVLIDRNELDTLDHKNLLWHRSVSIVAYQMEAVSRGRAIVTLVAKDTINEISNSGVTSPTQFRRGTSPPCRTHKAFTLDIPSYGAREILGSEFCSFT